MFINKVVYTDFNKLLSDYFREIYPTLDPTDNEFVESFDVCFDNWIDKNDWLKIISRIEEKLNSEILPKEKQFYSDFLKWLKTNIEWCDLIMVEGNL